MAVAAEGSLHLAEAMRQHTRSIWWPESRIYARGAYFQPSSCCNLPIRPSSRAVWRSTGCSCQSAGSASHTGTWGLETKGPRRKQAQVSASRSATTRARELPRMRPIQSSGVCRLLPPAAQRQPQLPQKPPQAGRYAPIRHQHCRHGTHQDRCLGAEPQGQG